ncbi:TadE family type IV pilus minor pilin [Nesterenkonia suensis]
MATQDEQHLARPDDDGAVSGEFAAALPAAVVMLALLLSLGMHAAAQVSLEEGARAAARELARGEPTSSAVGAAQRIAGDSAQVTTSRKGEYTQVTLTRPVRLLGFVELSADQTATAVARLEQSASRAPGPERSSDGTPSAGTTSGGSP